MDENRKMLLNEKYLELIISVLLFRRIDHDFRFDDAMAEYGCEVHSFDPR